MADIENVATGSQFDVAGATISSWTTVKSETSITTISDPLSAQRPSGTNLRYWVNFAGGILFIHDYLYRVTFTDTDGTSTVYDNLTCKYGIISGYQPLFSPNTQINEDGEVIHLEDENDTKLWDIGGAWQSVGNRSLYDSRYYDTGEPFLIMYCEHGGAETSTTKPLPYSNPYWYGDIATQTIIVGQGILFTKAAGTYKIKIERANIAKTELPGCLKENFGKSDPLFENVAGSSGSTYQGNSWGQGNIVGRACFATGLSNISTGYGSFVEGKWNVASTGAHAEGKAVTSSSDASHAEGILTTASAKGSHAEGVWTQATEEGAHAEGVYEGSNTSPTYRTIASEFGAHAEGISQASGVVSHSEGYRAEASAMCAHAEGRGTLASSANQHAQGKYNVADTAGTYAHIVGNGTSASARSNCHTLKWDGTSEYAGDILANACGGENPISLTELYNTVQAQQATIEALTTRITELENK